MVGHWWMPRNRSAVLMWHSSSAGTKHAVPSSLNLVFLLSSKTSYGVFCMLQGGQTVR
jgi:hypothetical protein